MKLGPCTFQGEFLPIIGMTRYINEQAPASSIGTSVRSAGTSLVIAPPRIDTLKMESIMDDETAGSKRPRSSIAAAGPDAGGEEGDEEITYVSPHGVPTAEVNTYKILALTSKRIVFKLVPGKGTISELIKVKSAK
jgi:hypothetical protein